MRSPLAGPPVVLRCATKPKFALLSGTLITPPPVTFPGVVCGLTTVVAVAVLLVWLVSVSLPFTLAVLINSPVVATEMCTTMSKLTLEPMASVPKLQPTVLGAVKAQSALADLKVTPTVRTSVTVPPVDVVGPLLVTVKW